MQLFMFFADLVGGDVGLAISSCITLTGMLQWGVRQSAEVENLMTSVERVMEYSRLEQETLSTDLFLLQIFARWKVKSWGDKILLLNLFKSNK